MSYKMYRIFQNIRNFLNIKVACVSPRYNVHYNRDLKEREKENICDTIDSRVMIERD